MIEVTERLDNTGQVRIPLDPAEALAVIRQLVADGIEALAVCADFARPGSRTICRAR
jgi:N-methylhydantoinase A/oxoprolinase/acetone carboxylase beta subunit